MPYWDMAIKGIFDKPFFGHGMIGMLNDSMRSDTDFIKRFLEGGSLDSLFMNMKRHGWKMHAHNILLDALYSFGLIGTLMLFFYGIKKGLRFFRSCGYSSRDQYFALTCGVIVSIFVNGLIDCEIVGAQTAVFTFMFVGVMGIYEGETNADVLYKLEPKLTDDD